MSPQPLAGKRVLALGGAFPAVPGGPLEGARIEPAALDRLAGDVTGYDLILVDANAWQPEPLSAALQTLSMRPYPPPVLLLGAHLPTSVVRNLLRLERSDVLEAPFTDDKLAGALNALMTAPSTSTALIPVEPMPHAKVWAVCGAVGGSGATTVAIEIANALCSRTVRERGVCLIDLNFADGASAAYLGANATMKLAEQGAAAERMDPSMLQAFVTQVSPRFDLLAAPRDPTAFDNVSRSGVLRLLETACEVYEWVILDIPRHRRSWTLEALGGCDEILVISELTVPALIAARSLSDEIDRGLGLSGKPKIVLNRLASRMFGPAPSMAEAERALQRRAEAGISSDWEAAAASVNLGGPIATHRPKSKIVKDVEMLVDRLTGDLPVIKGRSKRVA